MKFSSLLLASLATTGNAAVFDETEADYTVVVPAGAYHCYFQPMEKGNSTIALHYQQISPQMSIDGVTLYFRNCF